MASLFYLLAKKDGKGYEKLAKELFRTGEYKYNKYIVKPHENAIEMYSVNPYKDKDHPKLPEVNWLTLACVRSKESSFLENYYIKVKRARCRGNKLAYADEAFRKKPFGLHRC
ncbi:hypothetical protein JJC04_16250 [Flavobacterium covae]|nr:hypothetical protein [Flavobacterium covae]QYS91250.1 hypothetical protein JJC04_16250 [Flavobacterium covae]